MWHAMMPSLPNREEIIHGSGGVPSHALRYDAGVNEEEVHALKARESLAGAERELALGRYNNAANRAYYACFHAAVVALLRGHIRREIWSHDEVQSLFAGLLVNRRKL